jgi:hypothetical protein
MRGSKWTIGLCADTPQAKSFAQRKADAPLKPAAPQEPCDVGLFGDEHLQSDLVRLASTR